MNPTKVSESTRQLERGSESGILCARSSFRRSYKEGDQPRLLGVVTSSQVY
jgi:hypothetical protein